MRCAGWQALAAAVVLAAAIAALYWPATGFDFLAYDDRLYILENPVVLEGLTAPSVLQTLTDRERSYWMPLTWISYMADGEFFGVSAAAFHRTNVLLFAAAAGLLLLSLWRLTGAIGPSLAAAALVTLHPQRVESVAWIAERKDVLSTLFLVAALGCHATWVRRRRFAWRIALVVSFSLAVMAKPSALVLPGLLLVADYFPLGRIGAAAGWRRPLAGAVAEKLPLFAIALAAAALTSSTHHTAWVVPSFGQRLELAARTPLLHLPKIFFPMGLGITHFSPGDPRPLLGAAAAGALLLLTLAAARWSRSRPHLAAAWLWYLIPLVPVGWYAPLGVHWITDRFTLVPSIGLALGIAWGAAEALPARRVLLAAASVAASVSLASMTRAQLPHWRDTEAMFRRSVALAPKDAISWAGLAGALVKQGRYEKALACYERSVALDPKRWASRLAMLRTLLTLGRRGEAVARLREAAAVEAPDPNVLLALGTMLIEDGKAEEALEPLARALDMNLSEVDRQLGLHQRARALEQLRAGGTNGGGFRP